MSSEMTDEKLVRLMNEIRGFDSTKAFTLICLQDSNLEISGRCIFPRELKRQIDQEGVDNLSLDTINRYNAIPNVTYDLDCMKALWEKIGSGRIIFEDDLFLEMEGERIPLSVIFGEFVEHHKSQIRANYN